MADSQKMTPRAWDGEAIELLTPSTLKSPFGALASPVEVLNGSYLFEYVDGKQSALVAVKPVAFSAGNRLEVVGLRSFGDRLQQKPFFKELDALAMSNDARVITLLTQVPHVANACMKNGFGVSGAVLMKVINAS